MKRPAFSPSLATLRTWVDSFPECCLNRRYEAISLLKVVSGFFARALSRDKQTCKPTC